MSQRSFLTTEIPRMVGIYFQHLAKGSFGLPGLLQSLISQSHPLDVYYPVERVGIDHEQRAGIDGIKVIGLHRLAHLLAGFFQ